MPEDDIKLQQNLEQEDFESGESRDRIQETLESPHALMSRDKVQAILRADYMPGLIQLIASLPDAPSVDTQSLIERLNTAELSPEDMADFKSKIELFRMFCGQTGRDLRREMDCFVQSRDEAMPGMITSEILEQQEGFQEFLNSLLAGPASATSVVLAPLSDELRQLIGKPEALYERIVYETNMVNHRAGNEDIPEVWRKNPAVLDLPDGTFKYEPMELIVRRKWHLVKDEYVANLVVKKWIDLVLPTFKGRGAHFGLDTLGFIPEELYTKKLFRQKVKFEDLAELHKDLREVMEGPYFHNTTAMGNHNKRRLLHARAQLLRHLFTSGIAESVKKPNEDQVTLDANGLFINLSAGRQHKKAKHVGLHSHLPYSQVSDELLEYLLENQWISESDGEEIRLQRAKVNNDVTTETIIEIEKAQRYYDAVVERLEKGPAEERGFGLAEAETKHLRKVEGGNAPADVYMKLAALMHREYEDMPEHVMHFALPETDAFWRVLLDDQELHMPEAAFSYYLKTYALPTDVRRLMEIAAELQKGISDMDVEDEATPESDYKKRRQVVHDKRHYNVAKIVGMLLDHGLPPNNPQSHFAAFRSRFAAKRGDELHFLEIAKGSNHNELLIIPRKHLNARQRAEFFDVPELSRSEYEVWVKKFTEYNRIMEVAAGAMNAENASTVEAAKEGFIPVVKEVIQFVREEALESPHFFDIYVELAEGESDLEKLKEVIRNFIKNCLDLFQMHEFSLYNPKAPLESNLTGIR